MHYMPSIVHWQEAWQTLAALMAGTAWQRGTVARLSQAVTVPASCLFARGGLHPADVGAARHGGLAARLSLRVLRRPQGAAVPRAAAAAPGGRPGPQSRAGHSRRRPPPITLGFKLPVAYLSSQLGPTRNRTRTV
jgi:hypothetical protein